MAYGGQGRSFLDTTLVIDEMAQACGVTGRIAVEANMGAISALMHYGTETQKRLGAELVLAGDKPAICITEPGAGSAASEMTTRADQRGDGYVINGTKHWITGGGVSRLHLVFARVFDEDFSSSASTTISPIARSLLSRMGDAIMAVWIHTLRADYAHRDAQAFRGYVVHVLGYAPENIIDLRDRRSMDRLGSSPDRAAMRGVLSPKGPGPLPRHRSPPPRRPRAPSRGTPVPDR